MSIAEIQSERAIVSPSPRTDAPTFSYRALSSPAVSCLAFGVLSCLAVLDWWLAVLPACSVLLGLYAVRQIRRRPDELTGVRLAHVGMALAVLFWAGGWSWLGFVYATEVPEGYQRITYESLQPAADDPPATVPPASAMEFDGRQVFIKGYMYPPPYRAGIRAFLLVRDSGTCCFGGNPKLTDRIQVTLADPRGTEYAGGVVRLAGVFRITPQAGVHGAADVPGGILYQLEEAIVR